MKIISTKEPGDLEIHIAKTYEDYVCLCRDVSKHKLYFKKGIIKLVINSIIFSKINNANQIRMIRLLHHKSKMRHESKRLLESYETNPNLKKLLKPRKFLILSVCYKNIGDKKKPVGVLLIIDWQSNFYVSPKYRQQGIATILWNTICEEHNVRFTVVNTGVGKASRAIREKFKIHRSIRELLENRVDDLKSYIHSLENKV